MRGHLYLSVVAYVWVYHVILAVEVVVGREARNTMTLPSDPDFCLADSCVEPVRENSHTVEDMNNPPTKRSHDLPGVGKNRICQQDETNQTVESIGKEASASQSQQPPFRSTTTIHMNNTAAKTKQASKPMTTSDCQALADEAILSHANEPKAVQQATRDLVACVQRVTVAQYQDDINFQTKVRKNLASMWEHYACHNQTMISTNDIARKMWTHNNIRRKVHVKHQRQTSTIHLVEHFVHADECQAVEEAASGTLDWARVFDARTGRRYKSPNRKAKQAKIPVPHADHPIFRLAQRVFDYTNHVLGLNISMEGQEPIRSIQYEGRNDDEAPDQYRAHCDGDCTGNQLKPGRRMATMVMYCAVADLGGHTNFRNSGVHIKPEVGSAIFFSYLDPLTNETDDGYTEHSGCPVYKGSKKIVTQWIRLGVDKDHPWDSFAT